MREEEKKVDGDRMIKDGMKKSLRKDEERRWGGGRKKRKEEENWKERSR